MNCILTCIKENRIIIVLIIITCFILYFYFYCSKTNNIEKLTVDETQSFNTYIANKFIYINTIKDGQKLYLGNLDTVDCITVNKTIDTSCLTNITVLQTEKNSNCVMKINTFIGKNEYFLSSLIKNTVMAHKLNAPVKPSPYLCFMQGNSTNDIAFTMETSASGYVFVITVNSQKYYISECGITAICKKESNLYYKLCLDNDKTKALIFNFELAQIAEQTEHFTDNEDNDTHHTHNTNIETFDISSNISLLSENNESNCDTMSLPGPGDINDYAPASWD